MILRSLLIVATLYKVKETGHTRMLPIRALKSSKHTCCQYTPLNPVHTHVANTHPETQVFSSKEPFRAPRCGTGDVPIHGQRQVTLQPYLGKALLQKPWGSFTKEPCKREELLEMCLYTANDKSHTRCKYTPWILGFSLQRAFGGRIDRIYGCFDSRYDSIYTKILPPKSLWREIVYILSQQPYIPSK